MPCYHASHGIIDSADSTPAVPALYATWRIHSRQSQEKRGQLLAVCPKRRANRLLIDNNILDRRGKPSSSFPGSTDLGPPAGHDEKLEPFNSTKVPDH